MNDDWRAVIEGRERWAVVQGDCMDVMAEIEQEHHTVCITDPPWPNAPAGLFRRGAEQLPSLWQLLSARVRRIVVHLGRGSDPRCLAGITLPFLCTSWLAHVIPSYHGTTLNAADVAYTFGDHRAPKGKTVIPGECRPNTPTGNEAMGGHPTPRKLAHVEWLVRWFSNPDDVILDPFCGSGTTGVAAMRLGRRFFGIELEPRWVDLSRKRIRDSDVACGTVAPEDTRRGEQAGLFAGAK